jgi:hypothetical protein
MNIDPRVTWLKVTGNPPYPRYDVTAVSFQDETQSGGDRSLYVEVYDENGLPSLGARVRFNTLDEENEAQQTVINGSTNFPMSGDSSFDPSRGESGPYYVEIWGEESQRIQGFGLRLRRHETYHVRFQKVTGSTPDPQPGGITEARVRELAREEIRDAIGKWLVAV